MNANVIHQTGKGDGRCQRLPCELCFTGIFYYGSRGDCEDAITQRGGILRSAVSGSTDYVIIGGLCNPQWKHADSGTKIDAAKTYRDENRQWNIDLPRHPRKVPAIVRERDWVEALVG